MDDSSSRSLQETAEVPPDPTYASLPIDSSYLVSGAARTDPNRTPSPYTKTAYTADIDNGAVFDSDAG